MLFHQQTKPSSNGVQTFMNLCNTYLLFPVFYMDINL